MHSSLRAVTRLNTYVYQLKTMIIEPVSCISDGIASPRPRFVSLKEDKIGPVPGSELSDYTGKPILYKQKHVVQDIINAIPDPSMVVKA